MSAANHHFEQNGIVGDVPAHYRDLQIRRRLHQWLIRLADPDSTLIVFAPRLIVVSRGTPEGPENTFKAMRILQSNGLLDEGDTRRPHVFFVFVDRNRCAGRLHLRCGYDCL